MSLFILQVAHRINRKLCLASFADRHEMSVCLSLSLPLYFCGLQCFKCKWCSKTWQILRHGSFTDTFNPTAQKIHTIGSPLRWAPTIGVTHLAVSVVVLKNDQRSGFTKHYDFTVKFTFGIYRMLSLHLRTSIWARCMNGISSRNFWNIAVTRMVEVR